MVHHYYMQRLVFCALIKHRFKIDLEKMRFHVSMTSFLSHMQTLTHKYSQKLKTKKIIALVWKQTLYQTGFFKLFNDRGLFGPLQKNCYTSCLLHPNHCKRGTKHLWTLSKILVLVTWSKWWHQHYFWWLDHSKTSFFGF